MKRIDEEICKAQFDAFVKQFNPSRITWEEVPKKDERPDYYLCLDNTKFAVEVTILTERFSLGTKSSGLPPSKIVKELEKFVKKVENEAKAESCLEGNYLVSFSAQNENFAVAKEEIKKKLLEYIRRTRALERAPFERLASQLRPQDCGIQKWGSKPDGIFMLGPIWTKWEDDANQTLGNLLNDRLNVKKDLLERKGIVEPKILLLLNAYGFAERQMYENLVSQLSELSYFHTVFVVLDEQTGFALHSRNREWLI